MKLIALEEHVLPARFAGEVWTDQFPQSVVGSAQLRAQLADITGSRLPAMDAGGVDVQVLSSVAPGPQASSPRLGRRAGLFLQRRDRRGDGRAPGPVPGAGVPADTGPGRGRRRGPPRDGRAGPVRGDRAGPHRRAVPGRPGVRPGAGRRRGPRGAAVPAPDVPAPGGRRRLLRRAGRRGRRAAVDRRENLPFSLARADAMLSAALGPGAIAGAVREHVYVTICGYATLPPFFLAQAPISPADREKIAHLNAERLFKL